MNNEPDLAAPIYRQLLQDIHKEAHGLHLLSLVDIATGRIFALPDQEAVEQALLASNLFAGQATEDLEYFDAAGAWELCCFRSDGYQILPLPQDGEDDSLVVIVFAENAKVSKLRQIMHEAKTSLGDASLEAAMAGSLKVVRAWKFDTVKNSLTETYLRKGSEGIRPLAFIDSLDPVSDILPLMAALEGREANKPRPWLDAAMVLYSGRILRWERLPFLENYVLFADAPMSADDGIIAAAVTRAQNDILRQVIAEQLAAGLETRTEPFPSTDVEFASIVRNLRDLDNKDLHGRLVEGGFADHPLDINDTHMRCQECIYFLPNRRWCDLPELPIPVEPDWYCRLWKI